MVDGCKQIRIIRTLAGMRSSEFAKALGVSLCSLSSWENKGRSPHSGTRAKIEQFCEKHGIAMLPGGMPIPREELADYLAAGFPEK